MVLNRGRFFGGVECLRDICNTGSLSPAGDDGAGGGERAEGNSVKPLIMPKQYSVGAPVSATLCPLPSPPGCPEAVPSKFGAWKTNSNWIAVCCVSLSLDAPCFKSLAQIFYTI